MHDFVEPILPGGIVGNGRMLCSIRSNGMLHRLFWPHIDWGQHLGILKPGLQEQGRPVIWLDREDLQSRQRYLGDTNILVTELEHQEHSLAVSQTDLVLPENDLLVRVYALKNNSSGARSFNFILYCSFSIEESGIQDGMYYHEPGQSLIQYRRDVILGVKSPGRAPYGFHCGRRNTPSDPYEAAGRGEFWGGPDNIKAGAAALGWEIGPVGPGETAGLTLAVAAAHSEAELLALLGHPSLSDAGSLTDSVARHWAGWLGRQPADQPDTPLYRRSLLAVKIMSDRTSGASVAAPEFDSQYMASGGYGYCWPRDGMFVALALDEAGYHPEAGMFYQFAAHVQNPDGSWHQRYFMDGRWAPTWGRQIDQDGAVLWGYYHHFRLTGDRDFLNQIWPSVYSGARHLARSRLAENGLQIPTMDIWEDEFAQSTYASAAVYGGLKGASALAAAMGDQTSREEWEQAAESLKEGILSHQWQESFGSFTRSVNRRVSEGDYHHALQCGQGACRVKTPGCPQGYHALEADTRLDIALLGLSFPYGVLSPADPRMESTAAQIEKNLTNHQVGGIHRYQWDCYAGGNPWVLATLWMAIFRSLRGDLEKAGEYLRWAGQNSSPAGLLPEQVHRRHGGPAWVQPLNWSHAMYILASLAAAGRLSETVTGSYPASSG